MDKIRKTDDEWRALLTPEQFKVARKKGTERAFAGAYWGLHDAGTAASAAALRFSMPGPSSTRAPDGPASGRR
jgi:peptide methionine sulfoxide reductase MsrB